MTVLIVGAGTAGLTLARALARQGRKFVVFDSASTSARLQDRGLGLWGRSQAVLRALGLSDLLDDPARTLRIPAAAYRSRAGHWLSASSDTAANRVRVSTLLESELLAALEDGLPPGSVQRGATLVGAETGADGVALTLADGSRVEGTALVGADGVCSTVRRLVPFGGGSGAAVDTGYIAHSGVLLPGSGAPANLGGSVHRGESGHGAADGGGDLAAELLRNAAPVLDASVSKGTARASARASAGAGASTFYSAPATAAAVPAHAFETLSLGRRFAMVPLARGGAFWFATRRVGVGDAGEGVGGTALRELREAYDGWHEPIPQVLHFAACAAAEAAMGGPSASAGGGPRWERLWTAPTLPSWQASSRVVLVGDAAHGMPINLAQGAACGIEGAYLLSEAFEQVGDGWLSEGRLSAAFAMYEVQHMPRVRQCRAVTTFTDLLARPSTPAAEAARDAMRFVPPPLNGLIFDAALELSLGDAPQSTRACWPLCTAA